MLQSFRAAHKLTKTGHNKIIDNIFNLHQSVNTSSSTDRALVIEWVAKLSNCSTQELKSILNAPDSGTNEQNHEIIK